MTRDERQKLSVKRWLDSNGHGTLVCATGFGFIAVYISNYINYYRANTVEV